MYTGSGQSFFYMFSFTKVLGITASFEIIFDNYENDLISSHQYTFVHLPDVGASLKHWPCIWNMCLASLILPLNLLNINLKWTWLRDITLYMILMARTGRQFMVDFCLQREYYLKNVNVCILLVLEKYRIRV